jgi:hypothetical protein
MFTVELARGNHREDPFIWKSPLNYGLDVGNVYFFEINRRDTMDSAMALTSSTEHLKYGKGFRLLCPV